MSVSPLFASPILDLNPYENIKDYTVDSTKCNSFPKIRYEFDQAKIIFECADTSHRFAEAFHSLVDKYNKKKPDSTKLWFRIGIASGYIYDAPQELFYRGTPFFRASRLEKKAAPGEILVDEYTYEALSEESKKKYGKEEDIKDCKDYIKNQYKAMRYKVIEPPSCDDIGQTPTSFLTKE